MVILFLKTSLGLNSQQTSEINFCSPGWKLYIVF